MTKNGNSYLIWLDRNRMPSIALRIVLSYYGFEDKYILNTSILNKYYNIILLLSHPYHFQPLYNRTGNYKKLLTKIFFNNQRVTCNNYEDASIKPSSIARHQGLSKTEREVEKIRDPISCQWVTRNIFSPHFCFQFNDVYREFVSLSTCFHRYFASRAQYVSR